MEETKLRDEAIRIVFKYLNGKELHNASTVCKSWLAIGRNENKSRGPMAYVRTIKKFEYTLDLYSANKSIIECCLTKPSLYMFLTNYESSYETVNKCHCHLLPRSCYSIGLKNNFLNDDKNTLFCMTFPIGSNVQVFNYTFCPYPYEDKLYCPELLYHFNNDFQGAENLKHKLELFFETTRPSTSFMIIFTNMLGLYQLINEIVALGKWFPSSRVPIWGGVVDILSVCNSFHKNRECNFDAEMVHIIISGPDMAMWSLTLDDSCKTKKKLKAKLIEFKQRVNLKQHSMCFIFTPALRYMKLYKFESKAFTKVFPDVQVFHIYGHGAFEGNGFEDFHKKMPKILPIDENASTIITIFTYN